MRGEYLILRCNFFSRLFLQFAELPLDGAERLLLRSRSPAGGGGAGALWRAELTHPPIHPPTHLTFSGAHLHLRGLSALPKSRRTCFASSRTKSWLHIKLFAEPLCLAQGKRQRYQSCSWWPVKQPHKTHVHGADFPEEAWGVCFPCSTC